MTAMQGVRDFRETVIRIGAYPFRSALMKAYRGRCAITGSEVPQVLQAAHVIRYLGSHTNRVDNGLLLRVDLHQLFDKDLIGIDPSTREVHISKELEGTEYEEFSGRQITEPSERRERPNRQRLERRWQEFLKAEEKKKSMTLA
jgi:putative restriction endonuclease